MGATAFFEHPSIIAPADSSDPDPESSGSSSVEGSGSESEDGAPTPKARAMEVDGAASLVPEPRSPADSSQTLPTNNTSDDSDSGSSGGSLSSDDSSSTSDSDTDSEGTSNAREKMMQGSRKPRKANLANTVDTPAVKPPQKLNGSTAVTKKRRTDEIGTFVVTSITQQPKPSNPHQKGNSRKVNTPFSRIKVDEIKFADERLKDNTYGSRKAANNDYGAKANADLIVTRGAGFRKEKNKKKRGSYRGGEITVR